MKNIVFIIVFSALYCYPALAQDAENRSSLKRSRNIETGLPVGEQYPSFRDQLVNDTTWYYRYFSEWKLYGMHYYSFAQNGMLMEEFNTELSGEELVNELKTTYTYDVSDYLVQSLNFEWDADYWKERAKKIFYNNDQGQCTEYINYFKDNGIWDSTKRVTNTYDGVLKTSEIEWYVENAAWEKFWKYEWAYNQSGQLTNYMEYSREGNDWIYDWWEEFEYNAFGHCVMERSYYRDNGEWVETYRFAHYYNGNDKPDSTVTSMFQGENWVNAMKFTYSYGQEGFLLEEVLYQWLDNGWQKKDRDQYEYDENNYLQSHTNSDWHNDQWRYKYRYVYTNNMVSGIPVEESKRTIMAYPNPVFKEVHFGNLPQNSLLKITDLYGLVLFQKELNAASKTVDLSTLNPGVYMYVLKSGNEVYSGKLVKQ